MAAGDCTMHHALVFSTSTKPLSALDASTWLQELANDYLFLCPISEASWLKVGYAAELICDPNIDFDYTAILKNSAFQTLRTAAGNRHLDVNIFPVDGRRKKILIADMDSTIITSESLDDLANIADIGDAVAKITKESMAGKIDFEGALLERVAMLSGTSSHLFETLVATLKLTCGAIELVKTMCANGAKCYLISGGFDFITKPIAALCGFDNYHANHMHISNGKISGAIKKPVLNPAAKVTYLNHYCKIQGLSAYDAATIGDGANDLGMLQASGMGVAFAGKPMLRDEVAMQLNHTDLLGLLYLQGYQQADITSR